MDSCCIHLEADSPIYASYAWSDSVFGCGTQRLNSVVSQKKGIVRSWLMGVLIR